VPTPLFLLQAVTRHAVVDGPGSTDSDLRHRVASGQPPLERAALVQKIFDHAYRRTFPQTVPPARNRSNARRLIT
jgi:hypothetical protein